MSAGEEHRIRVRGEGDAAEAARLAREVALRSGLGATEAVGISTAVSEVASNQVRHARGGGVVVLWAVTGGVVVEASDDGPGIADVELALRDGWSSDGGLGLGLPGARRLMDRFELDSDPGGGTVVRMSKSRHEPALEDVSLATWAVAGGPAPAHRSTGASPTETVCARTPTGLLLGLAVAPVARRAAVDARAAAVDLAAALDDRPGILAYLSGLDGQLTWLARGGLEGVLVRFRRDRERTVATAPTRRAATLGVQRGDLLVLSSTGPVVVPDPRAGIESIADRAAHEARGAVVLAARVERGVLERRPPRYGDRGAHA